MKEWHRVKVKDITELITKGTTPSTYGFAFEKEGINYIRAEGISKDGYVDEASFLKISEECHLKLKRSQLKKNDILFSIAGMALGKTGIVKEEYLPANTNQAVAIIRPVKEVVSKYLIYHFINPIFYKVVNSVSGQAAQPNINLEQLGNLEVNLPSVPVQKKIVSILSVYDDLIENNLKRIKLLEELAQRTYDEWFVKCRINGQQLKINKETGLPERWVREKLGEVVDFLSRGISPKYVEENGIPVINQKCIRHGMVSITPARLTSIDTKISEDKFLQLYDILVNSTGAGTLGRVAQVTHLLDKMLVDTHVSIIRANKKLVSPILLGFSIKSQENLITNMGKGSTNQLELSRQDLKDLVEVAVPPKEIQKQFDLQIEPTLKLIAKLTIQNQLLKESRDILLPKLMSGQIKVK